MSSKIELEKTCLHCGQKFIARTTVTQYCSHPCSQRAYKDRKRNEKLGEIAEIIPAPKPTENKAPIHNSRDYLSVQQTADLMGLSRATVHRYCVHGKIRCVKINRKIFIRRKDIDMLFDEAEPYEVTPRKSLPPTEFYTLQEIMDKYNYSSDSIYKIVRAKQIPKAILHGKTVYGKKQIDRHFALKAADPEISEWYSVEEIRQKYEMSLTAVYSFNSEHAIPRKKEKGKTLYSRRHVDAIMQSRQADPSIKEWYSMDDIVSLYKLEPGYVSNLIYKNPIPKTRRGNKGYYSKEHFDALMQEKFPAQEYYTTDEATVRFGISRDALYQYIKRYAIPTLHEGRYVKISKPHLDKLFENRIIR